MAPAGDDTPNSGHHHLMIDAACRTWGCRSRRMPITFTSAMAALPRKLTLEPGEHTLQMLLGDHLHIPHDPPVMSSPITITVESSVETGR